MTQQFYDYVAAKPADEEYVYKDNRGCALYQFLRDAGYPVEAVSANCWYDRHGREHKLPLNLTLAAIRKPQTYGAILQRLDEE